ncbi:type IV pili methyl-accepting chemotaxis transducer N-terminal domain-containing protein [Paraburkholderia terricola]|uniref:Sensor protein n=1 Tax=Paraburkholderia terricola TaxID=169427 RepID=A0A1M6INX7_9BURK|nr:MULTISPECIES: type IV pili methyl-accepting chemotaxis transducer N-terminal domain-containing protein [Paraburkholderia]SDN53346.1 signal transduction histidine kinase, nitrate/nitrite-specific, NarQ [Paraburkholderia sediminicola]SHJ36154.1 signal transduction histidine kinase, nitrate/nitrite-specific, NarQ [Paraburkholderia terricola]
MSRFRTLAAKLGIIGGTLLLVAFASIGYTLWASWQLEGGAAAVNEAGRMRMQTWRLAQTLARGDTLLAKTQVDQFEQSVALLRDGDPSRPLLVPRDAGSTAAFADVQRTWQIVRAAWTASPAPDPSEAAQQAAKQAEAFVGHIDVLVSAIEVRLAYLTTILNLLQVLMVGLTIASAVTLLYSAYLFVFNPLERLRSGLTRVREGDLSARIAVESSDEFGAVSEGFNQMTETLQELYQNLEVKVEEKTVRLAAQHARLTALYEASAFAAHASTLDELADGFARQVRRAAKADASAIRWSDEANLRYLLVASDGLPRHVIDREQCIPTGDCHCGQAVAHADTRVIPIRLDAAGLLRDCGQAGFTTVISVPVQLQDRMIGEMDLFYRAPTALSGEDRTLLETMASHLAVAIEGLRAGALEREAAVAAERSLLAREMHDSIAQSLAFMKIQTALLRGALKDADASRTERTIGELEAGIHESLSDVRELLMHFRTRTNAEDIVPALQTTLKKFEHQTGLVTHLSIEGTGVPLPADVQVQVLHVVQEALSNVRKHAHAREVWLDVQQTPQWRVEVRDDGCGFATEATAQDETHVGLRIMHERAERIGAGVDIASVPGSGTCVVLTLPERRRLAA